MATGTLRNTLAPYLTYSWPRSVSWCVAEAYRNKDQHAHVAREALYFLLCH